MQLEQAILPEVDLHPAKDAFCQRLVSMCAGLPPLKTAIVHPVDGNSLGGAVAAAHAGLMLPVLVGPEAKIRATAEEAGLDISGFELVATEHSHAAAEAAVALARSGEVEALMKGKLHTDELMQAVLDKQLGLRTGRRMSHVFALQVPAYPKPLFLTDAALNIRPDLSAKRDIVQNAIDLFIALEFGTPRVALLSAVETVNEAIPSTLDATALCKMADRGQITGGLLDGPLAFDNAISPEAASAKGIVSQVAGQADILVVPDVESGNMLYKQLRYLFGVEAAGVVLGSRVPIILTSRAAGPGLTRLASSALALLYARKQPKKA
jgi:phosphotransacetylase